MPALPVAADAVFLVDLIQLIVVPVQITATQKCDSGRKNRVRNNTVQDFKLQNLNISNPAGHMDYGFENENMTSNF